jgi:hypothetical protein
MALHMSQQNFPGTGIFLVYFRLPEFFFNFSWQIELKTRCGESKGVGRVQLLPGAGPGRKDACSMFRHIYNGKSDPRQYP